VWAAQGSPATPRPELGPQRLLAPAIAPREPRGTVIGGPAAPATDAVLRTVRRAFVPWRVVARATADSDTELLPLLAGRGAGPVSSAFVCRGQHCELPVQSPEALAGLLGSD
jgi:uncharacterized protein YyaL (SSP411 family)